MLQDHIKNEITDLIPKYPNKRAVCIEALKQVQVHHRWISDEDISDIAAILDLSPHEVDSIATFYNLIFRKPVGRHVILICDSISCWIMGYETLLDHLEKRLNIRPGETTVDDRFTLLPIPCLGTCDHAPALMIDDQLYRDLTPEKLDKILKEFE